MKLLKDLKNKINDLEQLLKIGIPEKEAELAIEKGFNVSILDNCTVSSPENNLYINWNGYQGTNIDLINKPTQSLLQKWLRDKYNICIGMAYFAYDEPYWKFIIHYYGISGCRSGYEETLEIALQKALRLIK